MNCKAPAMSDEQTHVRRDDAASLRNLIGQGDTPVADVCPLSLPCKGLLSSDARARARHPRVSRFCRVHSTAHLQLDNTRSKHLFHRNKLEGTNNLDQEFRMHRGACYQSCSVLLWRAIRSCAAGGAPGEGRCRAVPCARGVDRANLHGASTGRRPAVWTASPGGNPAVLQRPAGDGCGPELSLSRRATRVTPSELAATATRTGSVGPRPPEQPTPGESDISRGYHTTGCG